MNVSKTRFFYIRQESVLWDELSYGNQKTKTLPHALFFWQITVVEKTNQMIIKLEVIFWF